jgi:heptosyltransferase-3
MAGRWEKLGKQLLFLPFRRPRARGGAGARPPSVPARLLVVRPDDRIGNVLLLTPLLDALGRAWPGVAIDVVVARVTGDLLAGDPRVARGLVFDKRRLVAGPWRLLGFARRLRARRYGIVLDASHPQEFSLTASLLVALAKGDFKIGYAAGPAADVLDEALSWTPNATRHQSEVFVDLLRRIVPAAVGGPLTLPLSPQERAAGRTALLSTGAEADRDWIGVHPGGRGAKRWPLDRFVALARALESTPGRRVLVFQGPGEAELVADWPGDVGRVVPPLPVRLFGAALAATRLVVAGDTGPMHLAQAVGTPTLAVFLFGNHGVFGPAAPPHRTVYEAGGPSAESVLAVAESMLSGG